MNSKRQTAYQKSIAGRSKIRYLKGLVPRFVSYVRNSYIVWLARKRGATIGECVTMPYKLAKKANLNLFVGDHSSIQTDRLDLRAPVKIGSYVIIGSDVEIITVSHEVDSINWEHKYYGIEIKDYCWLATRAFVLPSCQLIEFGAICSAGTVISKNINSMEIIVGNPGKLLRLRKNIHSDLCVEAMLGNDYLAYVEAYKR